MAANTYRNESDLQVNCSHSTSRAMKYVLGAYDLEPRFCADRFPSAVDQWRTWLHISKANPYPVIGPRSALKLDEAKREPQQCPQYTTPCLAYRHARRTRAQKLLSLSLVSAVTLLGDGAGQDTPGKILILQAS